MRNDLGWPALLAMTFWVGCGGGAEPSPAHGACEKPDGTFEPASVVCRPAGGPCDMEERCTGASPDCPTDAFVAGGTVCAASAGAPCDADDLCTGTAAPCPANYQPAGTLCRAGDLATCDPAESCTGASPECPPDETTHGTPPACCVPLAPEVRDGGFEAAAHGWPDWTVQSSTSYGTPLCDTVVCGFLLDTFPPRAGNGWALFGGGGLPGPETAQVGQVVDLSSAAAGRALTLSFWFKAAACGVATDFLRVDVDDTQVYATSVADEGTFCADAGRAYEARTVDLSAFAGAAHTVRFHSEIDATSSTGLLVDDVALAICLQ